MTYKTAWFMAHRLREAMREGGSLFSQLGGEGKTVEIAIDDQLDPRGLLHRQVSRLFRRILWECLPAVGNSRGKRPADPEAQDVFPEVGAHIEAGGRAEPSIAVCTSRNVVPGTAADDTSATGAEFARHRAHVLQVEKLATHRNPI